MSTRIECTLSPEAAAARRAGLLPGLVERAEQREATEDGYRLTFVPSTENLQAILSVVDAERQCCRWLRFELAVPPEDSPIVLTVSGPPGAREFLDELFAATARE
jgi:hypothetical protein